MSRWLAWPSSPASLGPLSILPLPAALVALRRLVDSAPDFEHAPDPIFHEF
jgi:hypothetical protein